MIRLARSVEVAEKNVAVVEQSWQQGLASQLEFRTAETDLLATRGGHPEGGLPAGNDAR